MELQESHGDGISHAFVWTGKREVVIRSVMIILPDLRNGASCGGGAWGTSCQYAGGI